MKGVLVSCAAGLAIGFAISKMLEVPRPASAAGGSSRIDEEAEQPGDVAHEIAGSEAGAVVIAGPAAGKSTLAANFPSDAIDIETIIDFRRLIAAGFRRTMLVPATDELPEDQRRVEQQQRFDRFRSIDSDIDYVVFFFDIVVPLIHASRVLGRLLLSNFVSAQSGDLVARFLRGYNAAIAPAAIGRLRSATALELRIAHRAHMLGWRGGNGLDHLFYSHGSASWHQACHTLLAGMAARHGVCEVEMMSLHAHFDSKGQSDATKSLVKRVMQLRLRAYTVRFPTCDAAARSGWLVEVAPKKWALFVVAPGLSRRDGSDEDDVDCRDLRVSLMFDEAAPAAFIYGAEGAASGAMFASRLAGVSLRDLLLDPRTGRTLPPRSGEEYSAAGAIVLRCDATCHDCRGCHTASEADLRDKSFSQRMATCPHALVITVADETEPRARVIATRVLSSSANGPGNSEAAAAVANGSAVLLHASGVVRASSPTSFLALSRRAVPAARSKSKRAAVLLYAGSFAPFHRGHLEVLHLARRFVVEQLAFPADGVEALVFPLAELHDRKKAFMTELKSWADRATLAALFFEKGNRWIRVDTAAFAEQHHRAGASGPGITEFLASVFHRVRANLLDDAVDLFWVNGSDIEPHPAHFAIMSALQLSMLIIPRSSNNNEERRDESGSLSALSQWRALQDGSRSLDEFLLEDGGPAESHSVTRSRIVVADAPRYAQSLAVSSTAIRTALLEWRQSDAADLMGNDAAMAHLLWLVYRAERLAKIGPASEALGAQAALRVLLRTRSAANDERSSSDDSDGSYSSAHSFA